MTTYDVVALSLGDKIKGDKIVFKTVKDLSEAYKDVDNDRDIRVVLEGQVTLLPARMLSPKLYEGTIMFSSIFDKKTIDDKKMDEGGNEK